MYCMGRFYSVAPMQWFSLKAGKIIPLLSYQYLDSVHILRYILRVGLVETGSALMQQVKDWVYFLTVNNATLNHQKFAALLQDVEDLPERNFALPLVSQ